MKPIRIYDCVSCEGFRFPFIATSKRDIKPDHSFRCEEIPFEELNVVSNTKILKQLLNNFEEKGAVKEYTAILAALKVFAAYTNTVSYRENNK